MEVQQFSITRAGNVQLTVPTWTVSGIISDKGSVLRDFTGANVVSFPQILGQLTTQKQDDFVQEVILNLIRQRFGIS